ncbi:MAG: hypothetical protein V7678_04925 [Brevundimonas sp.]
MPAERALLRQFLQGGLDAARFGHRDHVRVAWAMLGPDGMAFHEAYAAYRAGLVRLTGAAGVPEKFSESQTLDWLALVHESLAATGEASDFIAFEAKAGLHRRSLADRYPPGRLAAADARTGLILP